MSVNVVGKTTRLWSLREIIRLLVVRDLKVRYANSWLGYLWTVLDPLAMSLIYLFVFDILFHRGSVGHKPYFLFLIVGTLAWQWFSGCVNDSCRALLAEAKLVRSTNLPRELWVLRVVVSKTVEYVLSLPVLIVFTLMYLVQGKVHLDARLLLFPAGLVLIFVLVMGLGLFLAPITALVTDTPRVVRILLRMMFYFTPIIYSPDVIPDNLRKFMWCNPMTGAMELLRAGFFTAPVHWEAVWVSLVVVAAVFAFGVWSFGRLEKPVLKEI